MHMQKTLPRSLTCAHVNTHSLQRLVGLALDEGLQPSLLSCTIPRVHQVFAGQLSVSVRVGGVMTFQAESRECV